MEFLLFMCFIVVGLIVTSSVEGKKNYNIELKKAEREAEQRKQADREEEMRKRINDFVTAHGKKDLILVYSEQEMHYKKAINYASVYILAPPRTPTYTRGVVKGSIADDISVLANAQKKKEYNEAIDGHNETFKSFEDSMYSYLSSSKKILLTLESLPDSEEYVSYQKEKMSVREEQLYKLKKDMKKAYYSENLQKDYF